jgi:hypothetical protein
VKEDRCSLSFTGLVAIGAAGDQMTLRSRGIRVHIDHGLNDRHRPGRCSHEQSQVTRRPVDDVGHDSHDDLADPALPSPVETADLRLWPVPLHRVRVPILVPRRVDEVKIACALDAEPKLDVRREFLARIANDDDTTRHFSSVCLAPRFEDPLVAPTVEGPVHLPKEKCCRTRVALGRNDSRSA